MGSPRPSPTLHYNLRSDYVVVRMRRVLRRRWPTLVGLIATQFPARHLSGSTNDDRLLGH